MAQCMENRSLKPCHCLKFSDAMMFSRCYDVIVYYNFIFGTFYITVWVDIIVNRYLLFLNDLFLFFYS